MKKLKILLMTVVLSLSLCACGGKEEDKPAASDADKQSVAEQDVTKKKTSHHTEYECAPEVLESTLKDRMFQIGDVVVRLDGSMSLKEAIEAFENSDIEYEFKFADMDDEDETELNMERMILGRRSFVVSVIEDDKEIMSFVGQNTLTETATLSHDAVRLLFCDDYDRDRNLYFFNGIRSDGEGLTIDAVKELMSAYDVELSEWQTKDDHYVLDYSYEWEYGTGQETDGG